MSEPSKTSAEGWYALKTMRPLQLSEILAERGVESYVPVAVERKRDGSLRRRPLISRLMFIHATHARAEALEKEGRSSAHPLPSFWIYRFKKDDRIRPVSDREFRLFRLLTTDGDDRCEIYHKEEFKVGDRLRVTAGPFAGYEGYARRIRKNKHIVVEIEGLCAIALPFIHPDLLQKV